MRERSLGPGRQRYTTGNHRYGWLTFGVIMGVFAVVFAVTAFTMSDPPRRVGLAVLFLALTVMSVQFSRACVVIDQGAGVVRLQNLVRTVVIPLADVERFEVYMRSGNGGGRHCVQVRRRDGSAVWCRGLTSTRAGDTLHMARRLNEAIGLGLQAVVPAARIPDEDRAIAEFAQSLGKTPDRLSPAEWHVFTSERRLWQSTQGDTQHGQPA